jgi:hypothetical protein
MMDDELLLKWPQWPAQRIQRWLGIESLNTPTYYKFCQIGEFQYVMIVIKKPKKAGEQHPWPVYPVERIQTYLNLDLATTVSYQYKDNKYVVVWVEGPNIERVDFKRLFIQCE